MKRDDLPAMSSSDPFSDRSAKMIGPKNADEYTLAERYSEYDY